MVSVTEGLNLSSNSSLDNHVELVSLLLGSTDLGPGFRNVTC